MVLPRVTDWRLEHGRRRRGRHLRRAAGCDSGRRAGEAARRARGGLRAQDNDEPHLSFAARRRRRRARAAARRVRLRTGSRRSGRTSTRSSASSPRRSASRTPSRCRAARRRCTWRWQILGVGRGDEVLTSTLTFAATANAIAYVGATPVFIDVSPETWNHRSGSARGGAGAPCAAAAGRPAAVIAVDLYGQCADYAPHRRDLRALRRAADRRRGRRRWARHADRGRPVRSATCAAFSFNGNKIITTSGGGMLVSHRRDIVERARHLATQARDPAPHYEHSEIGYNYRLSNLLAAVGRGQLTSARREGRAPARGDRAAYRDALARLPGIEFMPEARYGRSNGWLTCITVDPARSAPRAKTIRLHLERRNIESRPVWKPMHLQPVFRQCRGPRRRRSPKRCSRRGSACRAARA